MQELGLEVTADQIAELESHVDDVDFEVAAAEEKKCRHDVMAHVKAYAVLCPRAAAIIHLGATSAYVTDNTVSTIITSMQLCVFICLRWMVEQLKTLF